MRIEAVDFCDITRVPGTPVERTTSVSCKRFEGLEFAENALGVRLQRGGEMSFVPWSGVRQVYYATPVATEPKVKP